MNAQEIKDLRVNLGLSQEAFAHLVGVSFGTINRWERGVFKPSRLALEQIKSLIRKGNDKNERHSVC
jgi:DNA-binding transcriptional regulator YiaG